MGEYAKYGTQRIKIGTCESMYYLRYEDRHKVAKEANSLDAGTELNLFWRLPFPDEDGIQPGGYRDYRRGLGLYRQGPAGAEWFSDETTASNPGLIQLRHESGLLVNVPCYHGEKLPELGEGAKAFWNEKGHFYELAHLKNTEAGVFPVIRCQWCAKMWRCEWSEVIDFIPGEMRERLEQYAEGVDQ